MGAKPTPRARRGQYPHPCQGRGASNSPATTVPKAGVTRHGAPSGFRRQPPGTRAWVVDGESVGVGIRESDGYITDYFCRFVPNVIDAPAPVLAQNECETPEDPVLAAAW
jgi:hypothetical protein